MENKKCNICIILSAIVALVIFGPFIYAIWRCTHFSADLLNAIIGVMIAVLSIAHPIIIGNVSEHLSKYNNSYIAQIFKKECSYRAMLSIIVLLIVAILLFALFDANHSDHLASQIFGTIITLLGIAAIIIFSWFIHRFTDYVIDTDGVITELMNKRLKDIRYDISNFKEHLEIIEIYSQIIFKKMVSKSYSGISDICQKMADVVRKIFESIRIGDQEGADKLNAISSKYYEANYRLWSNCFQDSPDTSRIILEKYEQILADAINSKQNDSAFEPLLFLYQRIANDIDESNSRRIPFCKQAPWEWYFNIVFNDKFNIPYLERANLYLFSTIKLIIVNNNKNVFEAFIGQIVDGMWDSRILYDFLYSNDKRTEEILLEIRGQVQYISTSEKIEALQKMVDKLDSNIVNKEQIIRFIHNQYKFNNLQMLTSVIGAYCLFKQRFEFVRIILFYNQPKESNVHYANTDIIPSDIQSLIDWYVHAYRLFKIYFTSWENHEDIYVWLKQFIAIMTCRLVELNHLYGFKYSLHYEIPDGVSKQEIEAQYLSIKNLRDEIHKLNKLDLKEIGLTENTINDASSQLEEILKYIQAKNTDVVINSELDSSKVENFRKDIINKTKESSIWINVFNYCSENIDDSKSYRFDVGLNELLPKSFLAQNDSGMYIGFPQAISEGIINQIDFYIERQLIVKHSTDNVINNSNFKTEIFKLNSDYIVIFINYFTTYDFLLNDKKFDWKNDHHLLGITGNGTQIMTFGDPANKTHRAIIIRKSDFSRVANSSSLDIKINDLNLNPNTIDNIVKANPYWLNNKFQNDEEKRNFLKQQVQIVIKGQYQFQIAETPYLIMLNDI